MTTQNETPAAGTDEPVPTFSEQVAEQLGGWRGLVESSIPVFVFVVANVIGELRPAVILAVAVALGITVWRLRHREPVRYALNGLFGVALGAALAWNTGEEKDFYLPGILWTLGYAIALLGSVVVRRPLVGWIWSVIAAGGSAQWRQDPRLMRTFAWLTIAWAGVYLAKVGVQSALYAADMATALGISRIALGVPPYAALLGATIWAVRRVNRTAPAIEG